MGLTIKTKKTNLMDFNIERDNVILIKNLDQVQNIPQVDKFKYLGWWIIDDLNPDLKVKTKIE